MTRTIRPTLAYDGTGFRGGRGSAIKGCTIEGELSSHLERVLREPVRSRWQVGRTPACMPAGRSHRSRRRRRSPERLQGRSATRAGGRVGRRERRPRRVRCAVQRDRQGVRPPDPRGGVAGSVRGSFRLASGGAVGTRADAERRRDRGGTRLRELLSGPRGRTGTVGRWSDSPSPVEETSWNPRRGQRLPPPDGPVARRDAGRGRGGTTPVRRDAGDPGSADRAAAGQPAPARGLTLERVRYGGALTRTRSRT